MMILVPLTGASKPTYDIWGDTVNVASRLESSGVSGRIQVSEQVERILAKHGQFATECRGPIYVKGKGTLTTYLVKTPYDTIDDFPDDTGSGAGGADDDHDDELTPPPTLGADDEVEELCASTSGQASD